MQHQDKSLSVLTNILIEGKLNQFSGCQDRLVSLKRDYGQVMEKLQNENLNATRIEEEVSDIEEMINDCEVQLRDMDLTFRNFTINKTTSALEKYDHDIRVSSA